MTAPLDDVDRALIRALIQDGRATYAKLAPTVGLSQAAVRTRVQRLLDEHLVVVTGRVDPASFGLGVFSFAFIEVRGSLEENAALVAEIDEAVFVSIVAGRFDLLVELRCADDDQLLSALGRIRAIDGVARVQTATVLHYEKQDWTGVGDREAVPTPVVGPTDPVDLDDVDRHLLRELIADGRATYAALAPAVGLSQAAVRDRVIDLVQSNVIAIAAHPVPEAMGIGGFAGIAITASRPVRPLASAMVEWPETTLVARTLGRYDLVAEVWFDDRDHLDELLERLRAVAGVGTLVTFPYLRIAKEEFGTADRI